MTQERRDSGSFKRSKRDRWHGGSLFTQSPIVLQSWGTNCSKREHFNVFSARQFIAEEETLDREEHFFFFKYQKEHWFADSLHSTSISYRVIDKKAHRNGIKKVKSQRHPNLKGVCPKFIRNQRFAKKGSADALKNKE